MKEKSFSKASVGKRTSASHLRNRGKGTRFAYDQGSLEIMVVSFKHDNLSRRIGLLVELIAAEMDIDIEVAGSTTFKREDLFKGFEPDESFYIRQPKRVRGKKEIDLHTDPRPDLVIEVDSTSPSLNKLPLFSGIGITEDLIIVDELAPPSELKRIKGVRPKKRVNVDKLLRELRGDR